LFLKICQVNTVVPVVNETMLTLYEDCVNSSYISALGEEMIYQITCMKITGKDISEELSEKLRDYIKCLKDIIEKPAKEHGIVLGSSVPSAARTARGEQERFY